MKLKSALYLQFRGPLVNVINFIGGNLNFPIIKNLKKFVLIPEPTQKIENIAAIFMQNNTAKRDQLA